MAKKVNVMVSSVFLKVDSKHRVLENDLAFVLYDIQPASKGHMLIIPKRVFADFFEATAEELLAFYDLMGQGRRLLTDLYNPQGFNIGVNIGEVAGQTVMHAHMHLIPRYQGGSLEQSEHIEGLIH